MWKAAAGSPHTIAAGTHQEPAAGSGPRPKHTNPKMITTTKKSRKSIAALGLALSLLLPTVAFGQQTPPAATRMNELGPENSQMALRTGIWDVTETVWETPDAAPVVTKGLVAERRMVGQMLQETLRLSADDKTTERLDYLSFNRVEGRWEYVSIDARAAVGLMTAQSFGREEDGKILVTFQPFAVAGPGQEVSGQMLRMRQEIIVQSADRDQKVQYFTLADGTGKSWLAHQYTYVRRP